MTDFWIAAARTESQRSELLPQLRAGRIQVTFAMTEAEAGSDAASMTTSAVSDAVEAATNAALAATGNLVGLRTSCGRRFDISTRVDRVTVALPPINSTNHFLNAETKTGQFHCSFGGTVAADAVAIDHD